MFNRNIVRRSRAVGFVALLALCPGLLFASSAKWVKLSPKHHPSARVNVAMAYDPAGKNIMLFGGYDGASYQNDTWIFNGTDWVHINTPTAPSPRSASAMAYDTVLKKIVMFGGYNGQNYMGDTWAWDGVTQKWTQQSPAKKPTPVTLPMLFTDPVSGHAEMVGGFDGFLYQNTTWKWTGTNWVALNPSTVMWARGAAIVANDFHRSNVMIFGGLADLNPVNTWTWDGVNWTMQNPATQPPWTYYSAASYYPGIQAIVTFGGGSGVNETWVWLGDDWREVPAQNPPPATNSQGMAYNYQSNQMIMFGGVTFTSFVSDTYQLIIQ